MPNRPAIPYPDHWYHDQDHIHCIVPTCGFVVPGTVNHKQWVELMDHCEKTTGTDHRILTKMLEQGRCAIDGCDRGSFKIGTPDYSTRALFDHEKTTHGSTKMSNICSFVTLAREGRIRSGMPGGLTQPNEEVERLAFERMMEKVLTMPHTVALLFRKHELQHPSVYPRAVFNGHLIWILTADVLEQPGDNPPYWWPIRAEHFLWLCRPIPNKAEDDELRPVWHTLREMYARGDI